MNRRTFKTATTAVLFLLLVTTFARTARAQFKHPGVLHSQEDLDRIKAKVAANEQPWLDGFNALANDFINPNNPTPQTNRSSVSYTVQGPRQTVGRLPDNARATFENDGAALMQQALMWYITGNQAHANKAIQIMDVWSNPANPNRLQDFTGADRRLLASILGQKWLAGAEIIRHTNAGWTQIGIINFSNMVRNIIYPVTRQYGGGNWGTGCVATNMAIGVFLDDQAIFEEAVNVFKFGAQTQCDNGVSTYIEANGQNSETDRDQAHSQLGIGHLAVAAEVGWQQGVDLYSYLNNRLLTGFEYVAKYNTGQTVLFTPSVQCDGFSNNGISALERGNIRPIFEMVWNHYENRMGLPAPFSKQAVRPPFLYPERWHIDHPGFGAVLFSRETRSSLLPITPHGLTASASDAQVSLSWSGGPGSDSYNVKRATARGGPFATIASALVATNYTDATATNGTQYYYSVSAVNGAGETINSGLAPALPSNTAPPAPTNTTASGTNSHRIDVTWAATPGATTYNIKRSDTSGGPYTLIATGVGTSFLNYADASLSANTTYYYVVSAVNHIGEGSNSAPASATTFAALPAPWNYADAGYVTTPGHATHSVLDGSITLSAAGLDLGGGNNDSFGYAYMSMTGDGTITARYASRTNYSQLNKAGLGMREDLTARSKHASVLIDGSNLANFIRRTTTGGNASGIPTQPIGNTLPRWLRLTRVGATITGYTSPDGTNWTQLSSANVPMNPEVMVGLAAASRNNAVLDTATFDNVSICEAPVSVITSPSTAGTGVGLPFNYTITATNSPVSFGAVGLPNGLSIDAGTGVISGAATTAGQSSVTLQAFNSEGCSGTATLVLSVVAGAPVITSSPSLVCEVGIECSYTITATNSQASFGWAPVAPDDLPACFTLNSSTGVISGTPEQAGVINTTVSSSNFVGTGTVQLTVTINPPVLTNGTWNNTVPLTKTLSFTNGSSNITFTPANPAPVVGDVLRVNISVAPFNQNNAYFVRSVVGSTLQLADTLGGGALTVTAPGTQNQPGVVFMNWKNSVNWNSGAIASGINATATFSGLAANTRIALGGDITVGHINFTGGASDLDIFGYDYVSSDGGSITFATCIPGCTTSATCAAPVPSFTIGRNATFPGNQAGDVRRIAVRGNQGLEIITTSDATTINFRPHQTIDWSGFSGDLQLRQGRMDPQVNNVFPLTSKLVLGNSNTASSRFAVLVAQNGRNQQIHALEGTDRGRVTGLNSTPTTLTVGVNDGSGDFKGIIGLDAGSTPTAFTQNIALIKTGTGTQILSGANVYTGATTINDGTLLVNGSITSVASVNEGTFGGSGFSTAAVNVGNDSAEEDSDGDSTLAPGSEGVGTFTTAGPLTLRSDASLVTEISSTTATADQVSANGVTISNASLTLASVSNAVPFACGTTFVIVNNTGASAVSGAFNGLLEGSTISDDLNSYRLSYVGGTGNDVTLTLLDTTVPVITLNGANPMIVECHTSFIDPGAVATDSCDSDVPVIVSGAVNVNVPGTYVLTYSATDDSNNAATSGSRTVNVVDTTAPIITLIGVNPMTVECHTSFSDPGVASSDSCDTSVPVIVSGSVNANIPGIYTLHYTAADDSGNTTTATRTVNVLDTIAPSITLNNLTILLDHLTIVFNGQTVTINGQTFPFNGRSFTFGGQTFAFNGQTVTINGVTYPLSGQTITLWLPNNTYRTVRVRDFVAGATDGCDSSIGLGNVVIEKVTSDEPENASGNNDGNTLNDIVIAADCKSAQLRAERNSGGNGRVYTITFRIRDASGNTTRVTSRVTIPRNLGGVATDNGPVYTGTSACP